MQGFFRDVWPHQATECGKDYNNFFDISRAAIRRSPRKSGADDSSVYSERDVVSQNCHQIRQAERLLLRLRLSCRHCNFVDLEHTSRCFKQGLAARIIASVLRHQKSVHRPKYFTSVVAGTLQGRDMFGKLFYFRCGTFDG